MRGSSILEKLLELRVLYLKNTGVRGEGWKVFAGYPRLEALHLDRCRIDGQNLKQLATIPNLQVISLEETGLRPEDIRGLVLRMPRLLI